jgi:hypothetical protein
MIREQTRVQNTKIQKRVKWQEQTFKKSNENGKTEKYIGLG